ncbi:RHS repeat domain-containing protein [Deminuibacter soli]|uniref:RHS repeat-associated core domain-containing protein n=1 Tax=Deminuibacter soli TaxID=2291815 RepID=A0A3E1NHS0_9BACT|nr:RHS repeat-associated core domain-containing protein [Deminuibacter soli]RFM27496.1 hypothetical protein DXN05_15915 [Deminuibacter soli]
MALEGIQRSVLLRMAYFNCIAPTLLFNDQPFSIDAKRLGTMEKSEDSTVYHNIEPFSAANKIILYKTAPGKLYVYNRQQQSTDSVPLLTDKYNLLLKEKTDVFLLYRGWFELQWQDAMESAAQLIKKNAVPDSSGDVYRFAYKQDVSANLKALYARMNAIDLKIEELIVPESKVVEQAVYDQFKGETSEITYLPGLGAGYTFTAVRGQKVYELTNHLGNVLATVSNRRQPVSLNNTTIDHYEPVVMSATDYYPFGMEMPGRVYNGSGYRYGFNGKENDNEVKGEGNEQDYGMRIYDTRLARFLSIDPMSSKFPMLTPYQFASNKPIIAVDLDGAEAFMKTIQHNSTGKVVAVDLAYDETIKALPVGKMYVQHAYPTGAIMKFENLGPLDFSNDKYGYPNKRGYKDYSVRKEYNPFYDPANINKTTLFSEFMTGQGAENSIIVGGKMLNDIKQMPSVQAATNDAIKAFLSDGVINPGETFSKYHTMTYSEGAKDIWVPSIVNGGVKGGAGSYLTTQHFLGSYNLRIDVLEDGKTGLFTLSDSKTRESVTDHQKKGNSIYRQNGKLIPWGSTYQRYIWIAPLEATVAPKTNYGNDKDNTLQKITTPLKQN